MNDSVQNKSSFWSRRMILVFIELYKENQCLYDTRHHDYKNNVEKTHILESILRKMQRFLPSLELEDIENKIETLHRLISEEFSLVDEAEASCDPSYEPKLWCYDQLKFLRKYICRPRNIKGTTRKNLPVKDASNDVEDDCSEYSDVSATAILRQSKHQTAYKWEKDESKIFIKLWKKYKVLYDQNHKFYKNRVIRSRALKKLLNEVKNIDPNINLKSVHNRILSFLRQYRKEAKRVKDARENNETYKPLLWCFDLLDFLNTDNEEENKRVEQKEGEKFSNRNTIYLATDKTEEFYDDYELMYDENEQILNESGKFNDQIQQIQYENEQIYHESEEILDDIDIIEYDEKYANENPQSAIDHDYVSNSSDPIYKVDSGDKELSEYDNDKVCVKEEEIIPNTYAKGKNIESPANRQTKLNKEIIKDLVLSKLKEISPRYHSDYVWDIQCLMRKYVLKSKGSSSESPSLLPTKISVNKGMFNIS